MDEGFLLLAAISPMESGDDALLLKFNKREGRVGEDSFEMYLRYRYRYTREGLCLLYF